MRKKIIVVDTNIFISALISPDGSSREILSRCLCGVYLPLMTTTLYYEYEAVMLRDRIIKYCPLEKLEREALLDAYMSVCQWVSVYYRWRPNLSDEGDNHVIELAVAGSAQAIITGNLRDFSRSELLFPGIEILKPSQFLEIN